MRKSILKKLSVLTAVFCLTGVFSGCGGDNDNSKAEQTTTTTQAAGDDVPDTQEQSSGEGQVFTENITGTADGYDYELWKDTGDTTFNVDAGAGTFSCEWTNINNALFRRGKKYDCTQTYDQLGNISIDYGVDYQPDGNSYMCVYGWTRDPLIEYYIVESWGTWRPPGAPVALGTVTVDGATYDIYKTTRYQQPSIDGTQTFDQYWSVRQTKPAGDGTKIEGTISISKHFDAWKKCGLELGKMYEVALTIEGYQSQGKATIYKNDLKVEGTYAEATDIEVTVDSDAVEMMSGMPTEAPSAAGFFESSFEDGTDGWIPRGSAMVAAKKDKASDGEQALFVSGRTDNWNGAAIMLDNTVYKPGEAYNFSVKVMQESGADVQMKLTMQYTKDGENYDQVALTTAASGEWVTLENPGYTIPEGAENLQLYVESPDSLTDFYVDEVKGADKAG